MTDESELPEDLILMDCCDCGRAMTRAEDWRQARALGLQVLGGKLMWGRWAKVGHRRPFCRACYGSARSHRDAWIGSGLPAGEWNGGEDNAVRALEGE